MHISAISSGVVTDPCTADGCVKSSTRRGLCHMHYKRFLKHGDINHVGVMRSDGGYTAAQRFATKFEKSETGCWEWLGAKFDNGYGVFRLNGKNVKAHRFSHEIYKGQIPQGLQIDHLCRNRACVNPDHLQAVTPRVNTLRSMGITALRLRQTHCIHGHEFTPENTSYSAKGHRTCITCRRRRGAEHDRKRRPRNRSAAK